MGCGGRQSTLPPPTSRTLSNVVALVGSYQVCLALLAHGRIVNDVWMKVVTVLSRYHHNHGLPLHTTFSWHAFFGPLERRIAPTQS